jgi:hypothetical protein
MRGESKQFRTGAGQDRYKGVGKECVKVQGAHTPPLQGCGAVGERSEEGRAKKHKEQQKQGSWAWNSCTRRRGSREWGREEGAGDGVGEGCRDFALAI